MTTFFLAAALLTPTTTSTLSPAGVGKNGLALIQSSGKTDPKEVLGKLGQATRATSIFAEPSTHSRIYYHLIPDQFLVLLPNADKAWDRVLLNNGWDGYVKAEAVSELPYQVTRRRTPGGADRGDRAAAASLAESFSGTPYRKGGADLRKGIDSGHFVSQIMGKIGMKLPVDLPNQSKVGEPLKRLEDLRAGDRLYFRDDRSNRIGRAAIYIGGGYCVSPLPGKGVATFFLGEKLYRDDLVAARR